MARTCLPADSDLLDELGPLIARARHKLRRHLATRLETVGESVISWPLLRRLMDHGGLSQRELAHLTAQHPAAVSRSLYDLEAGGLVERVRDLKDRRRLLVTLTSRGRKHCRTLHPHTVLGVADVLECLSHDERLMLRDLLRRIVGGVQDELKELPPE
jgi:MarR family transcriptional regulator, lower aerobic nicotinate degradation pathway regulator